MPTTGRSRGGPPRTSRRISPTTERVNAEDAEDVTTDFTDDGDGHPEDAEDVTTDFADDGEVTRRTPRTSRRISPTTGRSPGGRRGRHDGFRRRRRGSPGGRRGRHDGFRRGRRGHAEDAENVTTDLPDDGEVTRRTPRTSRRISPTTERVTRRTPRTSRRISPTTERVTGGRRGRHDGFRRRREVTRRTPRGVTTDLTDDGEVTRRTPRTSRRISPTTGRSRGGRRVRHDGFRGQPGGHPEDAEDVTTDLADDGEVTRRTPSTSRRIPRTTGRSPGRRRGRHDGFRRRRGGHPEDAEDVTTDSPRRRRGHAEGAEDVTADL